MLKQNTCPIEASNIANLGSELEHEIKLAAAKCEHAWDGIGQRPALLIWRIEKFQVVAWPPEKYGQFYDGDSYIVLHTYQVEGSDRLGHDVHFWLGSSTSQDEAGTAAYKTVELDDVLGGQPVQHREVQGHESHLFLSYFPERTIRILNGGIESGFNHVEETTYRPRLLWLKGNKSDRIRVTEVPMSHTSLNSGDVFILDAGLKIYQWNGSRASFFEKIKAGNLVRAIRDERGGKPEAEMFSEGDSDAGPFWDALGGEGPVKSASEGGSDAAASSAATEEHRMMRLSDASGSLTFTLEQEGALNRDRLDSNDVFIVDNGAEIFVWIGKNASGVERKKGMQYAQQYMAEHGKPNYLPISRVLEGGEHNVFEMCFEDGHYTGMRGSPSDGTHSCCPHYPSSGGGWAFHEAASNDAPTMFSSQPGRAEPQQEVAEKIVGEVFSFFAGKIKTHFFK